MSQLGQYVSVISSIPSSSGLIYIPSISNALDSSNLIGQLNRDTYDRTTGAVNINTENYYKVKMIILDSQNSAIVTLYTPSFKFKDEANIFPSTTLMTTLRTTSADNSSITLARPTLQNNSNPIVNDKISFDAKLVKHDDSDFDTASSIVTHTYINSYPTDFIHTHNQSGTFILSKVKYHNFNLTENGIDLPLYQKNSLATIIQPLNPPHISGVEDTQLYVTNNYVVVNKGLLSNIATAYGGSSATLSVVSS